jgi:transcription elongation factor SPT5
MKRIGKFLRHPPTIEEDSSNDSSEEEEEEEEEQQQQGIGNVLAVRKAQQRNANVGLSDSDDEEDDDEDEEDEEEEEEAVGSKRKRFASSTKESSNKRKGLKVSRKFFDEYAEASSDGSDEDEDEEELERARHDVVKKHYTAEDIRRENMDAEAEEIIRQQNLRRSKMHVFNADLDAGEIARQIEQRHKMESRRLDFRAARGGGGGDDASVGGGMGDLAMSAVGQQSLLPSVSDPSMWMFACSTGKEEELVYQIMNKCIAYAKQGKPLGITGVVAAQTKGKIFIESFSEPAVLEAVQGVRNLLIYSKRLVPITDMTTVMNVTRKKKPGTFFTQGCSCFSINKDI